MLPIDNDKVPDDIKTKKLPKINIPPEIQLDVLKCIDFSQLLSFQETSFYFKNFIDKYGKQLAWKKYDKLEIIPIDNETGDRYKEHKPHPKLYWFKLGEQYGEFEFCEQKYEFIKLDPQLYDFELGEQLEEKWKCGIEKSIPMFLTTDENSDLTNIDTAVCELQQNYNVEKALYYLQLPKFLNNIEEMKIARYLLQLFFNCAFEFFQIASIIINPQMIELLFDGNQTTNMPLIIHSQRAELFYQHSLNFALNHLICNQFRVIVIDSYKTSDPIRFFDPFDMEKSIDILIKLLAEGANKFSSIIYQNLDSKIYNSIIKHIETSQDPSQIVKEIKFDVMYGPLISSENAENIKTKFKEGIKTTKFRLANKHNPKIKFSVCIEDIYRSIDVSLLVEGNQECVPGVRVVIKRIS
ncbi:unnamed protein product [Meloidogyne enterolobii]|uniref:Uncharacterized protein n=1 Tax=Meloidogyne enterolobii TaxID=390850 RepID=A0ACB1B3W5_MELEN